MIYQHCGSMIPPLALVVCVQAIRISEGSSSSSSDSRSIQFCFHLSGVCNLIQQNCGSMKPLLALVVFLQAMLISEGSCSIRSNSYSRSIQFCLHLSSVCNLIQQNCGSMIPPIALVVCVQAILISEGSSSSIRSNSDSRSIQFCLHLSSVCK